ncbi:MAG: bifunctional UDP-N-acetylglucosamine diphosphorylase/glucosamine-1-phosphate N-acetyltransferase GlmU [Dehalococcoidia bacterium]|nr:bifunctional UDP-N-acetylglucosamine diphosphorylase/glucosamine-1-phosphate N-acetyltransferase GlmU [Dehalococcoidia bacterium]
MKSALPKVLHPVCGVPMAHHVLNAARGLGPARIAVVVGHEAARVREALAAPDVVFVEQAELLGTGDAVRRCKAALEGCHEVLVLNGDEPLVTTDSLRRLLQARTSPMAFITQVVEDPGRLGRVVRDESFNVVAIVQAADYEGADGEGEINWGEYAFEAGWLWEHLPYLPLSSKNEYYLTHLANLAYEDGTPAATTYAELDEALGVDDRVKLARAEALMRRRVTERHLLGGVTITDPATTYIDAAVEIDPDVTILPNTHLLGATRIASGSVIGPGTTLRNSSVGRDCEVKQSVIEESELGDRVRIGPFSHVRGNARIGEDCELGNFAEVKNSTFSPGIKMHHFSYMGDATIGEHSNIAAGAITCNWDGMNKNRTTIGARVFIGCDTMLVAPIEIGDDALTGAGSVVTKDVPAGERVAGVPARPLPPRKAD